MDAVFRADDTGVAARVADAEAAWATERARLAPPVIDALAKRCAYRDAGRALNLAILVGLGLLTLALAVVALGRTVDPARLFGRLGLGLLALAPLCALTAWTLARHGAARQLRQGLEEVSGAHDVDPLARAARLVAARADGIARSVAVNEGDAVAWSVLGGGIALVWLQVAACALIMALGLGDDAGPLVDGSGLFVAVTGIQIVGHGLLAVVASGVARRACATDIARAARAPGWASLLGVLALGVLVILPSVGATLLFVSGVRFMVTLVARRVRVEREILASVGLQV